MKRRGLLKFLLFEAIALNLKVDQAEAGIWSYQGERTGFWGELDPDQACSSGQAQSPINIQPGGTSDAGNLKLNYHNTPLRIVNNGRTIKVTDYSAVLKDTAPHIKRRTHAAKAFVL